MRMEFRRLTGRVMWSQDWSIPGVAVEELKMHAKLALMDFYDGDQHEFWPKAEHHNKAPEEIIIRDAYGRLLAAYDIRNMMADTRRRFVGMKKG